LCRPPRRPGPRPSRKTLSPFCPSQSHLPRLCPVRVCPSHTPVRVIPLGSHRRFRQRLRGLAAPSRPAGSRPRAVGTSPPHIPLRTPPPSPSPPSQHIALRTSPSTHQHSARSFPHATTPLAHVSRWSLLSRLEMGLGWTDSDGQGLRREGFERERCHVTRYHLTRCVT
jgi:hypothetical protein